MALPTAWRVYREFKTALGLKKINLETDTIKIALFASTSNCGDVGLANAIYSTLTDEVSPTNTGYNTGGAICANPTWNEAGGVVTFDAADPLAWTAGSAGLSARYGVMYSDTATNKDLIAHSILDSTPADVSVSVGRTLVIALAAAGIFTVTGGEA